MLFTKLKYAENVPYKVRYCVQMFADFVYRRTHFYKLSSNSYTLSSSKNHNVIRSSTYHNSLNTAY